MQEAIKTINELFNNPNPQSIEEWDDCGGLRIICNLNWSNEEKESFIESFKNFADDLKAAATSDEEVILPIISKYFNGYESFKLSNIIESRSQRASKLWEIKAPEIIIENELNALACLLVVERYAEKGSFKVETNVQYENDGEEEQNND